jgi:hypothetical protein
MSRSRGRGFKVTSSPSRICPLVGSSRPAIMRKRRRLAAAGRPEQQKNSPSSTVKLVSCTAVKAPNLAQIFDPDLGHGLLREFGDE